MDIKEKITQLVDKVKNDENFKQQFNDDPIKAVESVIGVDLPDEKIKEIVEGVKAKVSLDKLGSLFGK